MFSPNSLCNKIMLAILTAVLPGLLVFMADPTEARAESGWTLTSSASAVYQYAPDCGRCEESADIHYIGGLVDIRPEYRFTS